MLSSAFNDSEFPNTFKITTTPKHELGLYSHAGVSETGTVSFVQNIQTMPPPLRGNKQYITVQGYKFFPRAKSVPNEPTLCG